MALVATTAPYRQLWTPGSNVAEDRRYCGMFQVDTSTGALKTGTASVRPSAGNTTTAGLGDMFTVTQPSANQYLWLVQLTETAGQPVWVDAGFNLGFTTAGTGGAAPVAPTAPATGANAAALLKNGANKPLSIQASIVDSPSYATNTSFNAALSNTFYIWMYDTDGTLVQAAPQFPTNFNALYINFEVCVKPTAVPFSL